MPVDSFKYLPRLIAAFYQTTDQQPELPIPWTPLSRPLAESKFGLVTSGGLYQRGVEPPFDLARAQKQPTWAAPTTLTNKDASSSRLCKCSRQPNRQGRSSIPRRSGPNRRPKRCKNGNPPNLRRSSAN
ncbi:MAG: hypothetical protein JXA78_08865 [Anaerolineales bacterium]|nr:hypothetical protein [Anaerolineales bacterium]